MTFRPVLTLTLSDQVSPRAGRRAAHRWSSTLPDLCAYSASFAPPDALEELTAYPLLWAASAMPIKLLTAEQLRRAAASDDGAHRAVHADTARTALLEGLCSSLTRRARHTNGAHLVSSVPTPSGHHAPAPIGQQRSLVCHCCKPREDLPLASLLLRVSCTPWPGSHRRTGSPATHGQLTPVACASSTSSFALPSPIYATSTLGGSRPRTVCRMATLVLCLALLCFLKGSLPSPISSLTSRHHRLQRKGKPPLPPAEALMAHPCNGADPPA